MSEQDLRIVRTIDSIKTTFLQMLKEENGSIKKIRVTVLAKRAHINKGTFYLHYADIYELYNEVRDDFACRIIDSADYFSLLFFDPEEFLKQYRNTILENAKQIDFLWPGVDIALFCQNLNSYTIQKMYETCPIERADRYDIMIDVITTNIVRISITQQERQPETTLEMEPETTMKVLLEIIHTFFKSEA